MTEPPLPVTELPLPGEYIGRRGGMPVRVRVTEERFDEAGLREELKAISRRLAELPENPTDEQLLEWAKKEWPRHNMDYSVERAALTARLAEIKALLAEI
jgi:hypothetical protein